MLFDEGKEDLRNLIPMLRNIIPNLKEVFPLSGCLTTTPRPATLRCRSGCFAFVGGFAFIGAATSRCASTLRRAALFVGVAVTMDLHAVAVRARNVRARVIQLCLHH